MSLERLWRDLKVGVDKWMLNSILPDIVQAAKSFEIN